MAQTDLAAIGREVEIKIIDDKCDESAALDKAREFRRAGAKVIVGPLCFKFATALSKELAKSLDDIRPLPVIAVNDRNHQLGRLREVEELALLSISNSPDAEAQAVVDLVLPRFGDKPYAILDDGSVYGRGLADAVRLAAEEAGRKPIINANFRPLQPSQTAVLRRLAASGVEAIFVAAAPEEIVILTKDMKALGLNWQIATGEQAELLLYAEDADQVSAGLLSLKSAISESRVTGALRKNLITLNSDFEQNVLLGYALVELAGQIATIHPEEIPGKTYQTSIGPLTFNANGRATAAPFVLMRWNGAAFQPVTGQ